MAFRVSDGASSENPALHRQVVETELANGESEFVGHAKHVEILLAPTTAEYEPIPQSVHV